MWRRVSLGCRNTLTKPWKLEGSGTLNPIFLASHGTIRCLDLCVPTHLSWFFAAQVLISGWLEGVGGCKDDTRRWRSNLIVEFELTKHLLRRAMPHPG